MDDPGGGVAKLGGGVAKVGGGGVALGGGVEKLGGGVAKLAGVADGARGPGMVAASLRAKIVSALS